MAEAVALGRAAVSEAGEAGEPEEGRVGRLHEPVLVDAVVRALLPPGRGEPLRMVDATLGSGGHAAALLRAAPPGSELLGLDRDPDACRLAAERLAAEGLRVEVRQGRFSELPDVLAAIGWERVDAVLADLGVSSMQIDEPARGFSFRVDAPLDMRMDPRAGTDAAELLARISESELADLLRRFGELPRARRIAHLLCAAPRPATTAALRARVGRVAAAAGRRHDPATLVFQALRIAVNDELAELELLLDRLPGVLAPGGRVAVLAYQSLEDRMVKQRFAAWAASCRCPPEMPVCRCGGRPQARRLTRRPLRPEAAEVVRNPRARSARLRAVEWIGES